MDNKQKFSFMNQQKTKDEVKVITNDLVKKATKLQENERLLKIIFPDIDLSNINTSGEIQVVSPFPRSYDHFGNPIFETNPSASINVEKGLFYDFAMSQDNNDYEKATGEGFTLLELYTKVAGIPKQSQAEKIVDYVINGSQDKNKFLDAQATFNSLSLEARYSQILNDLHISREVAQDIGLGFIGKQGELFSVPVFLYGELIDIRTYTPNNKPKVKSIQNAQAGMIVGKPQWERDLHNNPITWICAGEKDMLAMRSLGYNAITFTGGEGTLPKYWGSLFKNRTVVVAYDNDDTGKAGGLKLSMFLKKYGAKVYNFTNHHNDPHMGHIKGGDMWDLINTYGVNAKQAIDYYFNQTEELSLETYQEFVNKDIITIPLSEATNPEHLGKIRRSTIQALNDAEKRFIIPSAVVGEKIKFGTKDIYNMEVLNKKKFWELDENNITDILYLVQDEKQQDSVIKSQLLKVGLKEEGYKIHISEKTIVTQTTVVGYSQVAIENSDRKEDGLRSNDTFNIATYVLGKEFKAGKKYDVVYKLVPNPIDKQKAVMIIIEAEELDDLKRFKLDAEVIQKLQMLRLDDRPLPAKLQFHYEQDLARVQLYNNTDLWLLTAMVFNTPLRFYLNGKEVRGYLDAIAIGESRSGKSVMATELIRKYNIGKIINADSTTDSAFLGGANELSGGGTVLRYGALPRENGGLVIMEEIKDSAHSLFPKLRSVRSSQTLKLNRVAGQLETELFVRLFFLSNPMVPRGKAIDMRTNFDNGLDVVRSIIPALEDLTRFDVLFLVDNPNNLKKETPNPHTYKYADLVPNEYYQYAIRWVWTRTMDEIIFDEGVESYIWDESKKLSKSLDTMENIYGTEAHIKVARLSVALAGLLLSSSEDFSKLIVKKEHVDYIIKYLNRIYNNDLFRWDETKTINRSRRNITDDDINILQNIWNTKGKALLKSLQTIGADGISAINLRSISNIGQDVEYFNSVTTQLANNNLITFTEKGYIKTTDKYKRALDKINKIDVGGIIDGLI